MDDDEFEAKNDAFMEWFQALPVAEIDDNVYIADYRALNMGRAIAVRSNMKNKILFKVPASALLTVANSDLMEHIPYELAGIQQGWLALVLVLMYEWRRGKKSQWAPYLDILPTSLNSLASWNEMELQQLRGCRVSQRIGKLSAEFEFSRVLKPIVFKFPELFINQRSSHACSCNGTLVDNVYHQYQDHAGCSQDVLLEDIETAFYPLAHLMGSLIQAYSFDVGRDPLDEGCFQDISEYGDGEMSEPEDTVPAMVPMADLMNADPSQPNAHLVEEDGNFEMTVDFDTKGGDQIFNTYGNLSRSEFLRKYGYIPEYSDHDTVEISCHDILYALSSWFEKPTGGRISDSCRDAMMTLSRFVGESFHLPHPSVARKSAILGHDPVDVFGEVRKRIHEICGKYMSQVDREKGMSSGYPMCFECIMVVAIIYRLSQYYPEGGQPDYHKKQPNREAFQQCELGPDIPAGLELMDATRSAPLTGRELMATTIRIGEQRILIALAFDLYSKMGPWNLFPPIEKALAKLQKASSI
ncbi:MAG: hypothetical protein M1814_003498 [Vezdaea aestivalis]|nr:MAG: hypothetical protein M1814_003498 [Vezdaea aestivalis]